MAEENPLFSGIIDTPVTRQEVITTSATAGAGVGASMALSSGTVSGAALVPVMTAAAAGVVASGLLGAAIGSAIGETDIVRDNLVKVMEFLFGANSGTDSVENITQSYESEHSASPYDGSVYSGSGGDIGSFVSYSFGDGIDYSTVGGGAGGIYIGLQVAVV